VYWIKRPVSQSSTITSQLTGVVELCRYYLLLFYFSISRRDRWVNIVDNHPTLQVVEDGNILFESQGKWLFPLFDLEDYLKSHPMDLSRAIIRDKVVGKAAALLALRLGFQRHHGDLMSDLAIKVLENAGVSYSFDNRVPQITCKTETILRDMDDMEEAYHILCLRAKRC
jgi:hypothetical protein